MRWLLIACVLALTAPLFNEGRAGAAPAHETPEWPGHFQGRMLHPLPLGQLERKLAEGFPGRTARFTDGEREVVMRWVTRPTRRLHPATDCYRGLGYEISEAQIVNDADGAPWRCFTALREGTSLNVCEQLRDRDGNHWTDVSAWYWAALLNRSEGPWLVTTVAAAETGDR